MAAAALVPHVRRGLPRFPGDSALLAAWRICSASRRSTRPRSVGASGVLERSMTWNPMARSMERSRCRNAAVFPLS